MMQLDEKLETAIEQTFSALQRESEFANAQEWAEDKLWNIVKARREATTMARLRKAVADGRLNMVELEGLLDDKVKITLA